MAERKREIQVKFWVTSEEKKMIRKKMILSRTANMGAYLRKMVIDGIIVNTDTTYLEKHFFEMHDSTTADTTGADVVKILWIRPIILKDLPKKPKLPCS